MVERTYAGFVVGPGDSAPGDSAAGDSAAGDSSFVEAILLRSKEKKKWSSFCRFSHFFVRILSFFFLCGCHFPPICGPLLVTSSAMGLRKNVVIAAAAALGALAVFINRNKKAKMAYAFLKTMFPHLVRVGFRRLFFGPKRPGWGYTMEAVLEMMRAAMMRGDPNVSSINRRTTCNFVEWHQTGECIRLLFTASAGICLCAEFLQRFTTTTIHHT